MVDFFEIGIKRESVMGIDKEQSPPTTAAPHRQRKERSSGISPTPRTMEAAQRLDYELELHQMELEIQNVELCRVQAELETQQIELELQNEELRLVQEELELSRNKYSELYDFAPVGYFTFDPAGQILEVNLAGASMLGVERSLLVNRPFSGFIVDAVGREAFFQHLETARLNQEIQHCGIRLTGKNGDTIHAQFQSVTVATGKSTGVTIFSSIIDGTVAKQLETEIQDAREYAENIVETVRKPLVVLDCDLRIISANNNFYETFKVTPQVIIGRFIHDIGNRQWNIPSLRLLFENILPNDTVFNGYEVDHDFPGVGRKVILLNARQIYRKNISSHIILLAMEDITERRRSEEELIKAGALQSAIFNSINFSSIATDAKGVIQIFNVGAERMMGYSAAEVVNKITPADISDPEEVIHRANALSLELETPITPGFEALVFKASRGIEDIYELTYIRKDGSRFPAVVSVTALRDTHAVIIGYLLICSDNTLRRQIEAERAVLDKLLQDKNIELEKAKVMAERASQAKSEFLSNMSHELRTPLGAILGFAQLMETGTPQPSPTQKRSIEQILKAGWYLLELINEILDLALIESGKLSLSLEPVSLSELLHECEAMIEALARKRGISVLFDNLDFPCILHADQTRTKQVIINLLSNAIKYNRVGGKVTVNCTPCHPNSIRISVGDTGYGLIPEHLAQLFQPFNRLGQKSNVEEGTGIGLVVSKRLVELMGGGIGVESTVGEGSVFWVELKLSTESHVDISVMESTATVEVLAHDDSRRYCLLYVEDNPANLMLVEDLVARRHDIRMLSARDGIRGIEIARSYLPDIILMDINLPGISGIEALKILTEDPATAHIPIIALSANAVPRDIEKGLAAGFFRYLTKPIKVIEFMDTLDVALKFAQPKATKRR